MVARVSLKGPRAGDSGDRGRILSIGRIAQKGFLEEMEFELGLDELGIGHEVGKGSGWRKWHTRMDIRPWKMAAVQELGTWQCVGGQ